MKRTLADALVQMERVAATDRELFEYADTAEDAWLSMTRRGLIAAKPL